VYTVLGGCGAKYEVTIDEILVRSTYRPSIAVARQYISPNGFIYLVGDSAHQNIPTGGYGMNMGLGDAFDLGWKLATVMKGHGGLALLRAYEQDRRPVALKTIERSGVHIAAHMTGGALLPMPYAELNSAAGETAKERVRKHYAENDGENRDLGIEMDYRYNSSICIPCPTMEEPAWLPSTYTPSTNPGSRAPHVFLKDGTAIFDKYGKYFSLIVFPQAGATENSVKLLLEAGAQNNVPVELVTLANEDNACKVWGNVQLVLVRPDGHVAWRGEDVLDAATAASIIRVVAGLVDGVPTGAQMQEVVPEKAFTGTVEVMKQDVQYELVRMGEFQT
jgi:FAD-dependent monooxygenase